MKLQNLPADLLNKVTTFLDPENRLMLLLALSNVREMPEVDHGPRLHCFFCFQEAILSAVMNEKVHDDEFAIISKIARYEMVSESFENARDGSQIRFRKKIYRTRDYTKESALMNKVCAYLGKVFFL